MARRIDRIFKALDVVKSNTQCNVNEAPVKNSVYKKPFSDNPDFNATLKNNDSYNLDLSKTIEEAEIIFLNDGGK